jgi:hypothetical protein
MKNCLTTKSRKSCAKLLPERGAFRGKSMVFLAGVCAHHLVEGLRDAGLIVARPVQWRLHG